MTSTPIRRGERASFVSPSQLHSPIMSAGKRYEQTTSEVHVCSLVVSVIYMYMYIRGFIQWGERGDLSPPPKF